MKERRIEGVEGFVGSSEVCVEEGFDLERVAETERERERKKEGGGPCLEFFLVIDATVQSKRGLGEDWALAGSK